MNDAQIQRAIEFLTKSRADFFARNLALQVRQDKFQDNLETLAKLTRDLVTLAQIHSQRLDRIEGIPPH